VLLLTLATAGTSALGQSVTDWRKIGGYSVDLSLASPVTGPVDQVWFSPAGSVLYARTRSGRVFQTADFETWLPASNPAEAPRVTPAATDRVPEDGVQIIQAQGNASRFYALGSHLFRSDDGGHAWENLTAYRSQSVIGGRQHSIATSPADQDQIVVANDFGVWRSFDGGLSWSGLNQGLPSLSVSRILSTPTGTGGTRIAAAGLGSLELQPGATLWQPAPDVATEPDLALRLRYRTVVGADLSAAAQVGRIVYAGTVDGRILVSIDNGASFVPTQMPAGATGPVERIFADPVEPRVALAVMGGRTARVLRTTNSGNFWDVLDGNLPDGLVHGIAADRAAGAIYLATDRGAFYGRADLENPSTPAVNWVSLTDRLPAAAATDVKLDPLAVQLYIAIEGYGVYATSAPHRVRNVRIVNGGDYSTRAAAPGSILSVIGGLVSSATAGGLNYPVLAGSETESQIQVPFEAVGPSVSLALRTPAGIITRDLPVLPVSPAILVSREGAPMLWDADSGAPLDLRNAARSNGRLQIWATGLGKVSPDGRTGIPAPHDNPPAVVAQVRAYLDRSPLQVTRATLVPDFVGFYLIEVQLPAIVNAGTSDLYISADGQESNHVQVTIEP
jgi:uncharacterized protein (TIGR03437 family)